MPEVISNTSPLQHLYQLGLLELLPRLAGRVTVPQSVVDDLDAGRALGHDLPEVVSLPWVTMHVPTASRYVASPDLGRGETDVLRLALKLLAGDTVVILDDAKAREAAGKLGLKLTGTLGGCSMRSAPGWSRR